MKLCQFQVNHRLLFVIIRYISHVALAIKFNYSCIDSAGINIWIDRECFVCLRVCVWAIVHAIGRPLHGTIGTEKNSE